MPANPKYLSSSGHRFLKISAGVCGGYLLSTMLHLAFAAIPGIGINLMLSGSFSGFLLWVVLMVFAFLARNGWMIWGIYLLFSFIFGFIAYIAGGSL